MNLRLSLKKNAKIGTEKPFKILQTKLNQPKIIVDNDNFFFISTFNPNNPKVFDVVKSGGNTIVKKK